MLYICIPSRDEAPTVGLVLWKIRKTFEAFPREYEILLVDDGSADGTADLLEPYAKALPLTIIRHDEPRGYARSVEELLRQSLERSDRPKRDAVLLLQADFSSDPTFLPELIRKLESGADLVVGEAALEGEPRHSARLVRRYARYLWRGPRVSGIRDILSGFLGIRLAVVRNLLRAGPTPLLATEGRSASAELLAAAIRQAKRVDSVPVVERLDRRPRPSRTEPWILARELWRAGRLARRARREGPDNSATFASEPGDLEEVTR
jgi:dolichol-phosphate mannosyltransferase